VAVDVDALAVCALGLDGAVRAHRQVARDHRDLSPAAVLHGAAALTEDLLGEVGTRALGVGLALPALLGEPDGAGGPVASVGRADRRGPVTGEGPVVLHAPNLPRLNGTRPAADLAARLRLPVTAGNEATLGALAHLDVAPDLVYVSGGMGVGGGIVLGGAVYPGSRGGAGELGHVVVDRDGPACGCGGRGCLEQYAGTRALLADAGAPDLDALDAALARGDARAVAAAGRAGEALGVGLATVLNVLDVPVVVLGGALARLAPAVLPRVRAELARRCVAPVPVRVVVSDRGEDAAVRGAAEAVLAAVVRDPDRLLAAAG
jgi:predicted NBD/HSP70 family sugar kinase